MKNWEYMVRKKQTVEMGKKDEEFKMQGGEGDLQQKASV